jgi:hypothetical protein
MRFSWREGVLTGIAVIAMTAMVAASDEPAIRWLVQSETHGDAEQNKSPQIELHTLHDIYTAIRRCYQPPPIEQSKPGMRITVQFTYTRDGVLFGQPRILYETSGATPEQQSAYRYAVAATLARCSPLPFSKSLGAAVAGRVLGMQFHDARNLRGA